MASTVFCTSFAADMFRASGYRLVESFARTACEGVLVCAYEGDGLLGDAVRAAAQAARPKAAVAAVPIARHPTLVRWLTEHADVIPAHLGGRHDGLCRCPGGPLGVHDKAHVMPCVGHWFNRNASRWFRKVVALEAALSLPRAGPDRVVWLDSDCVFKKAAREADVDRWFGPAGAFYLKRPRRVCEAGVHGYDLRRGGRGVFDEVRRVYLSGEFRNLDRWDDSYVLQKVLRNLVRQKKVQAVDLARGRLDEHGGVLWDSVLAPFLVHDKGRHGRGLGIMT